MSLKNIASKYLNHLNSLERMLELSDLIEKQYLMNNEDDSTSIFKLIDLVVEIKSRKLINKKNGSKDEDDKFIEEFMTYWKKNKLLQYVYNNITVRYRSEDEEDDDIIISVASGFLQKLFNERIESREKFEADITHYHNSIVISLVTYFELLIGEILKDFMLNLDQSDFLSKKSLTFKDLVKIGSLEEASEFLMDSYIEDILRGSIMDSIKELEEKIKIQIYNNKMIKEYDAMAYLNETIQRRHILIHNDRIVNDLYLTKTEQYTNENVKKGDVLASTEDYINERIKLFKKVGITIIYLYAEKRYRNNIDEFFSELNDILLSLAIEGCSGARYVYKELFNNPRVSHETQLLSKINYYLSYKLNEDFELVREEVESFFTETLSIEYRMAKNILLDNTEEAYSDFKQYINGISPDEFFNVIDWPLIKLIKEDEKVKTLILDKISEIINVEEREEVENLTI